MSYYGNHVTTWYQVLSIMVSYLVIGAAHLLHARMRLSCECSPNIMRLVVILSRVLCFRLIIDHKTLS